MKQSGFWYEVKPVIELSRAEVDALIVLSSRHYDSKCKSFSQPGGLLFGYRNTFEDGKDAIVVTPDTREVDTLCKILEGTDFPGAPEAAITLRFPLNALFRECLAEFERVNPEAVWP